MKTKAFIAWVLCFVILLSAAASAESADSGWLQQGFDWFKEMTGIDTNAAKETVQGWVDTVSEFASGIKDNPEIQEAWNTLKDGALKQAQPARKQSRKHII